MAALLCTKPKLLLFVQCEYHIHVLFLVAVWSLAIFVYFNAWLKCVLYFVNSIFCLRYADNEPCLQKIYFDAHDVLMDLN